MTDDPTDRFTRVAAEAVKMAIKAHQKWKPYNSAHEGFAVLLEEVDELRQHVWMRQDKRDLAAMRAEALDIAACAIRFAADTCDPDTGRR